MHTPRAISSFAFGGSEKYLLAQEFTPRHTREVTGLYLIRLQSMVERLDTASRTPGTTLNRYVTKLWRFVTPADRWPMLRWSARQALAELPPSVGAPSCRAEDLPISDSPQSLGPIGRPEPVTLRGQRVAS